MKALTLPTSFSTDFSVSVVERVVRSIIEKQSLRTWSETTLSRFEAIMSSWRPMASLSGA